jgi:hypothetical protein
MDTSQSIKIKFNNRKDYSILDLEKEIKAVIRVVALAEAITSDNNIDNFMVSVPFSRDFLELEERFGKRVKVESISHNSPTLLCIIISYKVAEILLRYFDKNNPNEIEIDNFQINNNVQKRLLADLITALEVLKDIIDEIK